MPHATTRMDLRRSTVILVDDNPLSLEILMQVFLGFRVKAAIGCRSGGEAGDMFGKQPFDLIVIDDEMPGEDGATLTRRLRLRTDLPNFAAPVIMTSGCPSLAKLNRARDAGANMLVKKPIAPGVMLNRIEWLARNGRDFITSETYCGPDRRFRNTPLPDGMEERRADALALTADLDRTLSQGDIDNLFG